MRPHLEYGQAAWSPHLTRDINALENVQIRATKLVDGLAKLDYDDRLKRLNLPTLAFRRQRGEMIEIFKHYHTYDRKTLSPSFHPRTYPSRQHNFHLIRKRPKYGKSGLQYNSFYYRCQSVWNKLPSYVVDAKNINTFKNALDAHWENHLMCFDHSYREAREEITSKDEEE